MPKGVPKISRGRNEWTTYYKDTGCKDVSPSCLNCPLAKCKYEDPAAYYVWRAAKERMRVTDPALKNVHTGHVSVTLMEYAQKRGVSVRTAYRHMAKNREKENAV